MVGAFACPECGADVTPRRATAGRTVRCAECGTLVEIPFLARSLETRARHRRQAGWLWAGGGVAVAVLMVVAAVTVAHARGRAARHAEFSEAMAEAASADRAGRLDDALASVEKARTLARRLDRDDRSASKALRNRLALREAEAHLDAVRQASDPASALDGLLARVRRDPALEPLRDRVMEARAEALASRAEIDLDQASRALASGHPETALELCERVGRIADDLGYPRSAGLREASRSRAREAIARVGVVIEPIRGEFLDGLGSSKLHGASLGPILSDALRRKGYVPRPDPGRSAFRDLWDQAAPYRVAVDLVERNDGTFFQTPTHTARIHAHVSLMKGETAIWQSNPQGRTRVPPPDMSPFEMSRLSVARERDRSAEKRLYDDARSVLADNLRGALRGLPSP